MNSGNPIRRATLAWLAVMTLSPLVGCGPKSFPVDPEAGKQAMNTFLKAWSAGEAIASLESKTPRIVGADEDWQLGHKLLSFEVVETKVYDRTMLCMVKLTVQRPPSGEETEPVEEVKYATYTVGTQPYITIFRD